MVEIGCIELINRVESGRTFHRYFNPQRPMPPEAQAVHGLSDAFLADKPLFADVADELLAFLGTDAMLVAHNATFDFGFVDAELRRSGRPPLDRALMVDTMALARKLHPGAKHSLDALCTRYGIDRSHRVKHGALLDAELLAQLYIEMTGGRQIGLSLVSDVPAEGDGSVSTGVGGDRIAAPARPFRAPRIFAVPPAELQRHAEYLERMQIDLEVRPLWFDHAAAHVPASENAAQDGG